MISNYTAPEIFTQLDIVTQIHAPNSIINNILKPLTKLL